MDLNPSYPAALGLEWFANDAQFSGLNKSPIRLVELPSTTAQTVDAFRMEIDDTGTTGQTFTSLIEVFDQPLLLPASTITTCTPNADAPGSTIGSSGWRRDPGGNLVNLWAGIDDPYEWPPPPSALLNWAATATGAWHPYHFYLDTSGIPAGHRIIRVRFRAVIGAMPGTGAQSNRQFQFKAVFDPGGTEQLFPIPGGNVWGTLYTTPVDLDLGEINPVTRQPWTLADLAAFDGGMWAMRVEAVGNASSPAGLIIAQFVVSSVPENRAAVAVWERPEGQGPGLITTDSLITMPAGTAGWAKPGSGQFKYGWRIADDRLLRPGGTPSSSSTRWLTARDRSGPTVAPPAVATGAIRGTTAGVDQYGRFSTEPVFVDTQLVPNLQMMVGAAVSTDSFAYTASNDLSGIAVAAAGTTVAQEITPSSNQSYIGVRFVVAPPNTLTSSLTVTVNRVSDGVQMGGSLTVTAEEVRAGVETPIAGTWTVEGFLSAGATLVSGTQYEIRYTVTGGGSWTFPRLRATSAGAWTFGGTTDALRVGGSRITDSDTPVILLQQPDPPDVLEAEVLPVINGEGVDCMCDIPAVDVVSVTYQNGANPALSHTEIWRFEDRGDWPLPDEAWELVHTADYATAVGTSQAWADWSAPRGVAVQYRIRNYTLAGAFSEWRYSEWVTPRAYSCELIFTSNQEPGLTVVYQHEPKVEFEFVDHATDRLVRLAGRPLQVAFVDPVDRGLPFAVRIIASFGRQPCDSNGRPLSKDAVFAPLRRITRAELPYVVVLDSRGGRHLAHVELSSGVNEEPAFRYHVTARVTPVAERITPTEV